MTLLIVALVVVLAVALSFKKVRTYLKYKVIGIQAKGSAFIKIAEADAKELEIKSRIVAIDAANKAKSDAVTFYKKEADRVHAAADQVKADFDSVLAAL